MTKLKIASALAWLLIMSTDCHAAGRQTRSSHGSTTRGLRKARTLFEYHENQEYKNSRQGGALDTRGLDDDTAVEKNYSTGRSCKSRGKGKGKDTCAPSSSPSAAPTVSIAPSSLPSTYPSRRPSATPSASPSMSPSLSSAPSYAPSDFPSASPTDRPSTLPSLGPTHSVMPSAIPTGRPSSKPSLSPTDSPSQHPSMLPSQAPSFRPTNRPSMSPTDNPTNRPSMTPTDSSMPSIKPSAAPSSKPSDAPSSTPSVSNVPTEIPFATASSSDGFESVCENTLPAGGTTQEQTLAFKYNLYITPLANAADVTLSMETFLHFGMARNFLGCDFAASSTYYIVSIRSNPGDTVSDDPCDTLNDPIPNVDYECVVVNAEMSMTAFFPSSRRMQETDANPDVLEASADYLEESMRRGDFKGGTIVQVSFQGFVNVQEQGRESPGASVTDGGVAGIIGGQPLQPTNDNSSMVAGSTVIGFAAVVLMIVTVFSVRFRNGRRQAYLRHLEELSVVSDLSLGEKRTAPLSSDGKVYLVMEEEDDVDSLEEAMKELDEETVAQHDVRQCASATCQVCRNRELQPTFISTGWGVEDIADLRARPTVSDHRSSYRTPDTVVL